MDDDENDDMIEEGADRRAFLKNAGRFAVIVPPAMTLLLSTTMASDAIASSCNRGLGNLDEDCDPGKSSGRPGAAGEDNEDDGPPGQRGRNGRGRTRRDDAELWE